MKKYLTILNPKLYPKRNYSKTKSLERMELKLFFSLRFRTCGVVDAVLALRPVYVAKLSPPASRLGKHWLYRLVD